MHEQQTCTSPGKGREMRALPAPEPTQRITAHPHSAPLYKIRTDDMLPLQLLTPQQARFTHCDHLVSRD